MSTPSTREPGIGDFDTKGFSGLTLRLFDPVRAQWSLNWVNSRTGLLQPPVVGRFHDDWQSWETNWTMAFRRTREGSA
ncbi:hypothetical protein ABZ484_17760 [Streptomyces sp. NPDC006393]|uniref:hypothetical protein n=1 Tax=Streptomyces sp. NPDC006393 TaxID=3156763 RepID=UPI0033F16CCA